MISFKELRNVTADAVCRDRARCEKTGVSHLRIETSEFYLFHKWVIVHATLIFGIIKGKKKTTER